MIRVALIDDHPLILKIVRQELSRELDIEIIWESQDSAEMIARIARQSPDVLVLDLSFSGQAFEPVAAVRDLQARFPHMAILILTGNDDPVWIEELLRAGAKGYVIKSEDFSLRLADAVRTVAQDRTFLSPSAALGIIRGSPPPHAHRPRTCDLAVGRTGTHQHGDRGNVGDRQHDGSQPYLEYLRQIGRGQPRGRDPHGAESPRTPEARCKSPPRTPHAAAYAARVGASARNQIGA